MRTRLRVDRQAPALLLSPHWDDAVLDCWSLLASDRELHVVNVFAGVPAGGRKTTWEAIIGVQDCAERARGRIAEDALALADAGRRPFNLPLLDREYRGAPFAVGLGDLDRALSSEVESASRVYVPAGIGGHVDHVLTRRYGCALLGAGMPVTLYADLPYCVFHGWPAWVDGAPPEPRRSVDAYWQSFLSAVPAMPPLRAAEVVRLDAPSAGAKLRAIQRYEMSLNYGFRRLLADPAFHGFEVRWDLIGPGPDVRAARSDVMAPAAARTADAPASAGKAGAGSTALRGAIR